MADRLLKEWKRDRREALLSLDETKIRAYLRKYGETWQPSEPRVFWGGVHKARVASLDLPDEARELSRQWLKANGFREGF